MVVRIGDGDAGRENGKIVEFTAIERKIGCALRPDNDAKGGSPRSGAGAGRPHLDDLRDAADLHDHVDLRLLVDLQHDAPLLVSGKAVGRDRRS